MSAVGNRGVFDDHADGYFRSDVSRHLSNRYFLHTFHQRRNRRNSPARRFDHRFYRAAFKSGLGFFVHRRKAFELGDSRRFYHHRDRRLTYFSERTGQEGKTSLISLYFQQNISDNRRELTACSFLHQRSINFRNPLHLKLLKLTSSLSCDKICLLNAYICIELAF